MPEALQFLSRLPKKDGTRISWDSSDLDRGTFEVIYNLTFTPAVDDHLKDGAVWHVLNECARTSDFAPKSFLRRLQKYLTAHFDKEKKKLVAFAQVNATTAAALPHKISSIHGPIEIRLALPQKCQKVITNLETYERSRLGLHSDFVYSARSLAAMIAQQLMSPIAT